MSHQLRALQALEERKRVMLYYAPGTGKSLIGLEALECYPGGRLFMPSGAIPVWQQQAEQWAFEGDERPVGYHGALKLLQSKEGRREGHRGLPVVIADECHRLKSRSSTWTKSFTKLVTGRTSHLLLMTGTPMTHSTVDLYQYLVYLFPGDRRYTSYWRWMPQWFQVVHDEYSQMGKPGRMYRDPVEFVAQFEDRLLYADVDEALPGLSFQTVEASMTPKQKAAYVELRKTLDVQIGDVQLAYFEPGSQWAKLLQITTGLQTVDPNVKESGKLPILEQVLSEREHMSTIVFCSYRGSADAVCAIYPHAARIHGGVPKVNRRWEAARFQAGETNLLVATYPAAAEGWNLQAASTVVRLEPAIRMGDMEQSYRRAYRLGQKKHVSVLDITVPGTVESGLRQSLIDAVSDASPVQAAMKAAGGS